MIENLLMYEENPSCFNRHKDYLSLINAASYYTEYPEISDQLELCESACKGKDYFGLISECTRLLKKIRPEVIIDREVFICELPGTLSNLDDSSRFRYVYPENHGEDYETEKEDYEGDYDEDREKESKKESKKDQIVLTGKYYYDPIDVRVTINSITSEYKIVWNTMRSFKSLVDDNTSLEDIHDWIKINHD